MATVADKPVPVDAPVDLEVEFEDYFGFDDSRTIMLPDGKQWVQHRVFNEGQRKKFLNESARDVRLQRGTGDAFMKMRPGDERAALLSAAIIDWHLLRKNKETGKVEAVPFTDRNLQSWLLSANPRIVDIVEKEIRKANPWLLQNISVEDIDQQITELQEMREVKVKEEEGKASS